MPTLEATPNVIDFNHLVPPIMPQVEEEEFADPLTPEEEIKVRQAEEEISRGECYIMHAYESAEEFFARIDADPVGTKLCNTPEWQDRQYLKNRL